jgi:hypothetical protein
MKRVFLVLFFFVFAVSLLADAELDAIREAIKEKGAQWQAGITSMNILPKEERRMRLGYIPGMDPTPEERGQIVAFPPNRLYDDSLDWRNYNGKNYITRVQDQGACGSCVCFGLLATAEGTINIQTDVERPDWDLSEQELLSCSGASCNGWNHQDAENWFRYVGVSEEACFPYMANDNIPCSNRCARYEFTKRQSTLWGWCYPYVWGIKDYAQYGPVHVAFEVYEDFYSYSGGVYEHTWGNYEGGHSVSIVGWNDADSCWIVKNSWGENWGEDGYFRIKWGECHIENSGCWMVAADAEYPYLVLVDYSVDDSQGGDGDGVLNPGETGEVAISILNWEGWDDANYVDATLRTNDTRIVLVDSTSSYGTILAGETKDNASDPFVVQCVSDGSIDPCSMTVYVTAVGTGGTYWIELEFEMKIGWMQYGWPVLHEQVKTSPLPVSLNGDLLAEVVYGTEDGNLFGRTCFGQDFESFPYHVPNKIWGSAAGGDVDNDGNMDIAFAGFNTNIYLVDRYGNLQWSVATGGPVIATPALVDLDDDNKLEIVVGSFDKKLYVLRSDGTNFNANFPLSVPDGSMIAAGCAVGDINGDNIEEIIVASYGGNVYAFDTNGGILSGFPYTIGGNVWGAPSIGNLDGSGMKIAVGSTDDSLYVINANGTLAWKAATGGDVRSSPSFADIDGDNDLEVFCGSDDNYVYAFHHTGSPVSGWPVNLGGMVRSQVVFSDVNNDNDPEILVTADNGVLYLYDASGGIFATYATENFPTTVAVEDIDNDGDFEFLYGTLKGASAIDYKDARGTGTYWNMFRCNRRRTGNYGDAAAAVEETETVVPSVFNIYPNPFLASARIFFTAQKGEEVTISFYNIAGQKVKDIKSVSDKIHRNVRWSGMSDDGKPVPAGVYFCVTRSGGGTEVIKKLIKIR